MNNMKKLFLIALLAALSACGGDNVAGLAGMAAPGSVMLNNSGIATPAAGNTVASPGAPAPADSNAYLVDAYQDSLAEIQLAQLALQKSSNTDVTKFAQRMVDDHTAMNKEITSLAQQKNVSLPSSPSDDQKATSDRLSGLSGNDFDLAYIQENVSAHEKDVAGTRTQSKQGTDPDVKLLATVNLPILKTHLGIATEINSVLDPAFFLAEIYRTGLAEIQMSQAALQKSTNPDVMSFAQRMIDDHTQANSQATTLAQQKGISLPSTPSSEQQATADELANFSGADFDKAYMDANVIGHGQAWSMANRQAVNGKDADIRAFASNTVNIIQHHLITAARIDQALKPSYLYQAFQDSQSEIALAHLALLKSGNADVKAFAQRMIDDHKTMSAQIQQLAMQTNVVLPAAPSPEQALAFVTLMRWNGALFDRGYMAYNVRSHEQAVAEATQQASQATNPDVRAFAQSSVDILNQHLQSARTLRDQLEAAAKESQARQSS